MTGALLVVSWLVAFLMCLTVGRGTRSPVARSAAWRTTFIVATVAMVGVWAGGFATHLVAGWSVGGVLLGTFLGAVAATATKTGLVEDHSAPSPDVQDKILAFHRDPDLRYPRKLAGKRVFDVVVAGVGIVTTLPLWFLVAALVWIEEPGPVLFVKYSVKRGGVTFRQFKFRSMHYHAESLTGPVRSFPGDPRTLRVGRWLRRWHLDELPELVNVLSGSMSLVGPRPLRSVLVQGYLQEIPGYAQRHTVKPGLACIAQIDRYRLTPQERLRKDKVYIRRMGLRTDLTLLVRAVLTTLAGRRDRAERAEAPPLPDRGEAPDARDRSAHANVFYLDVLGELLRTGVLHRDMRILVVCGGRTDQEVLAAAGFRRVVISNIDATDPVTDFAPYTWSYQDAERLTYPDRSFDFCLVHSGLHHCYSPHRALLEMYRVSRAGMLVIEPYDNLLTRLGVKLGFGQEYEHAGVFCNRCHQGGVANTPIPNYVYRWTEREIVKTVHCAAPHARHDIVFIHKMRLPWTQLRNRRNRLLYRVVRVAQPALKVVEACAPRQSNNFAALVLKPDLPGALHPWLRHDGKGFILDDEWMTSRYSHQ
ncbi:sugar transferase [Asanoa iriomotensis]|uniref:Lipopolysaccharide/colanic/teichoic acid biosynthesis glycosyltransferase n=1 Tax=Asanoa iriomotensis TaxID=234613 RepID=A0ABQ4BZ73_9ACTN|nr:sugar transferase [Asanoa iriomotensis]GIF55831.1 hypothetical protein Air01nite_19260 [Asanoa iriomotensis]